MASHCDSQSEHEPELDYSSSSFDEGQEEGNAKGVETYRYEPYTSEESVEEEEMKVIARDIGDRLNNTEWCMCAQCQAMPTAEESQCCHEIARTYDKITGFNEALKCITDHPGFFPVCLDQYVLETAYYQYRQQYDHMINTWKTAMRRGGIWHIGSSFDGVGVSWAKKSEYRWQHVLST